jgi:hypothetical protein
VSGTTGACGVSGVAGSTATSTPTASTAAAWDANVNMSANAFFEKFTTTATAAGTTTMTITSTQIQEWTGSTTQTIKLPTTSVPAGAQYLFINDSTGIITIQSSGANTIITLAGGTACILTALVATPTTAANWSFQYVSVVAATGKKATISNNLTFAGTDGTTMTFPSTTSTVMTLASTDTITGTKTFSNAPVLNALPTGTAVASAATASTIMTRDASVNTNANNVFEGFTTTATAAGTTTMSITSTPIQVFTGSTTQTIKLPTTSVPAGGTYNIINQSTGALTVQSSGANTIAILPANSSAIFTAVVATPTSAANWAVQYTGVTGYLPYKFSVYLNQAQNTSSNTYVAIQFNAKTFDTGSNFDAVTNFRFTAPIAGFYWLGAATNVPLSGTSQVAIKLTKNASTDLIVGNASDSTAFANTIDSSFTVGGLVQLAAGDTVQALVYCNGAVAMTNGASLTYFHGFLVSTT